MTVANHHGSTSAADGITWLTLGDLPLATASFATIADWLTVQATDRTRRPAIVSHINVANYHILWRDPELKHLVRANCVLLLDGIGHKLGAFARGWGVVPDLNGTDLFPLVIQQMATRGARVYFLGAREPTIRRAAERVQKQYPGITVTGYHHGYFSTEDEPNVIAQINSGEPDLLVIGMGFPRQELFALRNRDTLRVPLVWTVGGLFDFLSGETPRAPRWMRSLRLEWLFRFLLEPRRLWYRIVVSTPWYLQHTLLGILRDRNIQSS